MSTPLLGKVAALAGPGGALHRALALAAAGAGADIALATLVPTQAQEFAVNSIANEIWALGREHFASTIDAGDATAAVAFAEETFDRLGRGDVLVIIADGAVPAELDELSAEEWRAALEQGLTAPFLLAQSFGRLMERAGTGRVVFVMPQPHTPGTASTVAAAAISALAESMNREWGTRNVRAATIHALSTAAPEATARLLLTQVTRA